MARPRRAARTDVVRPFQQGYHAKIFGDFLTVGNAVLGCPAGAARCEQAQQRATRAGNNAFDMRYVNADPSLGARDSSVSRLTIPPGAKIAYARLYWAGNTGTYKLGRSTLLRCDASHPDAASPSADGCVGGWALNVVYRYDGPNDAYAPHRRAVYVYSGHVLQRSADPPTEVDVRGFQVGSAGAIRAGVVAYEGDWNVPGSKLAVNGTLIDNPNGGGTNKFFDSYAAGAVDPSAPNNMSVDAKDFTIPKGAMPAGSTSARLTFSTSGDTYLPQALAFSVPLPDIVITKTARPARVHPGRKVHYTITVTNRGGDAEPNARFTDDLSDVIDDAAYQGDARASAGSVSYDKPKLHWHGDLPAGATATITYSARVRPMGRGNGHLRNVVISDHETECPRHRTDPRCRVTVTKVPRGAIKDRGR